MKLLLKGDTLALRLANGKGITEDTTYRWSDFVVPFSHNGKAYLYNTLTKRLYEIEGESFDVTPEARLTSSAIAESDALGVLVADLFLVPEKKDEAAFYESFVSIARVLGKRGKTKGYRTYTILPTTACNARCFYCFEQGIQYVTMNEETLEQTIRFILDTHARGKRIKLSWFGGEPLMGERMIDKVCAALRNAGVDFYSATISNGSLITDKIIEKMKNDWNLRHIQITLDGVEEEYNRRKNYYFNYESAYWHVLSRLKMLNTQTDIHISIRLNIDADNIDGIEQMLCDVDPFLPNKERVNITLSPLYGIRADGSDLEVLEKSVRLYDIVENAGYYLSLKYPSRHMRLNYCMADSPETSVVIAPDGKLYACENIMSFPPLGSVWDGVTNKALYQDLNKVEKTAEKCKGCPWLPDCTSFTRCAHVVLNCKQTMAQKMEHSIKKIIDTKAYDEQPETDDDENDDIKC